MNLGKFSDVPITLTLRKCIISGQSRVCLGGNVKLIVENNLFYNRLDPVEVQVEIIGKSTYIKDNLSSLGEGNFCADPEIVRS